MRKLNLRECLSSLVWKWQSHEINPVHFIQVCFPPATDGGQRDKLGKHVLWGHMDLNLNLSSARESTSHPG